MRSGNYFLIAAEGWITTSLFSRDELPTLPGAMSGQITQVVASGLFVFRFLFRNWCNLGLFCRGFLCRRRSRPAHAVIINQGSNAKRLGLRSSVRHDSLEFDALPRLQGCAARKNRVRLVVVLILQAYSVH